MRSFDRSSIMKKYYNKIYQETANEQFIIKFINCLQNVIYLDRGIIIQENIIIYNKHQFP